MKKALRARWSVALNAIKGREVNWLSVLGFALVSCGIGMIFLPAGLIAGGISLLLLDWSVEVNGA